jgi:ribonuclease R
VDVYRCILMRDKVGQVFEARVSGLSGSGMYAVLDEPFVDVLVKFESMGPDRYEASDDGLSVFGARSGDRVSLGDRITLVIEDVALLRRTIYGRRVPPAQAFVGADEASPDPTSRPVRRRQPEEPPAAATRRGSARRGRSSSQPSAAGAQTGAAKGRGGRARGEKRGRAAGGQRSGRGGAKRQNRR